MATTAIGNTVSNTDPFYGTSYASPPITAFGYIVFGIGAIDTLKPVTCANSMVVSGDYAVVPRAL